MKAFSAVLLLLCLAIVATVPGWAQTDDNAGQAFAQAIKEGLARREERCIVRGESPYPVHVYVDAEEPERSGLEDVFRQDGKTWAVVEKKRRADFIFKFEVKWSDSGVAYRLMTIRDTSTRQVIFRHAWELPNAMMAVAPEPTPILTAPVIVAPVLIQQENPYDLYLWRSFMQPGSNKLFPGMLYQQPLLDGAKK